PAGHKIEVSISPTYWPQIWPSKEVANIKVDLEYSQLILPLIDHFEEVQLDYPLSETAQPLEKIIHREGSRTRDVTKRLTTNEWELRDYSDEGLRTLKDSHITYGTENLNIYTIKEDDPLSAKVQCDWKVIVKDDDIDTEVETFSTMTCDEDYYYLYNKVVAYNEGEQCFSKTWKKKIERDFT
ncbi:MAG TPA: peptidase S15, partial [Staphylococcus sp.]|nr:peptidase S15 [Staphylococcus sp.]